MRLAIGTAQFGSKYGITNQHGKVDITKAKKILNLADSYNINTLDTAYDYRDAHKLIGSLNLNNFNIISKLPKFESDINIYENIKNKLNEILYTLKVKYLNGILIHDISQLSGEKGDLFWKALKIIKEEGYVKNIGYSLYNVYELDQLYRRYKPDIVQIPCNIFDQRFLQSGWIQRLYDENVLIFIRSIFLQGLLLLSSDQLPKQFTKWNPLWVKYDNWLHDNKLSALEACLNFFLNDKRIFKIIVGIENEDQLKEILQIRELKTNYPIWMDNKDVELLNPSLWQKQK